MRRNTRRRKLSVKESEIRKPLEEVDESHPNLEQNNNEGLWKDTRVLIRELNGSPVRFRPCFSDMFASRMRTKGLDEREGRIDDQLEEEEERDVRKQSQLISPVRIDILKHNDHLEVAHQCDLDVIDEQSMQDDREEEEEYEMEMEKENRVYSLSKNMDENDENEQDQGSLKQDECGDEDQQENNDDGQLGFNLELTTKKKTMKMRRLIKEFQRLKIANQSWKKKYQKLSEKNKQVLMDRQRLKERLSDSVKLVQNWQLRSNENCRKVTSLMETVESNIGDKQRTKEMIERLEQRIEELAEEMGDLRDKQEQQQHQQEMPMPKISKNKSNQTVLSEVHQCHAPINLSPSPNYRNNQYRIRNINNSDSKQQTKIERENNNNQRDPYPHSKPSKKANKEFKLSSSLRSRSTPQLSYCRFNRQRLQRLHQIQTMQMSDQRGRFKSVPPIFTPPARSKAPSRLRIEEDEQLHWEEPPIPPKTPQELATENLIDFLNNL